MNNKLFKINIIGRIRDKFRSIFDRDPDKIELSPRTDWAAMIIGFLVLSFIFVFFYRAMFASTGASLEESVKIPNDPKTSIENITKAKLDKTLAPWKEREIKFNEYFNTRPAF